MTDFKPNDEKTEQAELVQDSIPPLEAEPSAGNAFSPGSIIRHYKVLSHLGSGGMSDVYSCEDLSLKRTVAIKAFRSVGISNAQLLKRFQTEGKAIARLEHPNILRVYGFDSTDEGQPFLVMECVTGVPLSKLLENGQYLTAERVMRLGVQLCDALAAAHSAGVIHRDLKPSNIIVANPGADNESIKLLDFGIAKVQEDGEEPATKTGDIFGTPQYMSPEQAQGQKCDSRTDQYSLGCVLFHMITGRPPFSGQSALAVLMSHVQDRPPSLASEKQSIPVHIQRVITKLLEKEPAKRFDSMTAVKDALLAQTPIAAPGQGSSWTVTLIFALFICSLIAVVAFTLFKLPILPYTDTAPGVVPAVSEGPDIVTNGTFAMKLSSIYEILDPGDARLTGWRIVDGSIDIVSQDHWNSADGENSLNLNDSGPGAVEQDLKTIPGAKYVVRYYTTAHPLAKESRILRISAQETPDPIDAVAVDLADVTVPVEPLASTRKMHWRRQQWTFVAKSKLTTLRFASQSPGPYGPCIDGVRVYRVK